MDALIALRLDARPYSLTVSRVMSASPADLYRAWTEGFDTWFAARGRIEMRPVVGEPFTFQTEHAGEVHPHYGRFLRLVEHRLVELTWVTGASGTAGAETVVTVELEPLGERGTHLRLTHAGFYDAEGVARHEGAWRDHVLPALDEVLRGGAGRGGGAR